VPASELTGFPGQLDLVPEIGTALVGETSYLVYPRARHERTPAAGELVVVLVIGERAPALRATLARLRDPALPAHRLLILDRGSDDWSFADSLAQAAARENVTVYRAPDATTLGALYRDALELAGSAVAILVPVDPELAASALAAFGDALARMPEASSAIAGSHDHLIHGDAAAAALLGAPDPAPAPLLALRCPVTPVPSLDRCTTPGGVALALGVALRHGFTAVAPIALERQRDRPVPLDDVVAALRAIEWPASSSLLAAATRRLGRALEQSGVASADAGELLAAIASAPRATVVLDRPAGSADESTHAFAAALDRAGIAVADPPGKLIVVPTVVDVTVFHPGAPPIRLGKDGAFTFLLVTPWDRATGWDAAIAAYAHAFTARDPVSLVIVVTGPEGVSEADVTADILAIMDGDDTPDVSLQTTSAALGSLPSIYTGADCLISPAADVPFERSALEAMACGVPVCAPLRPVLAGVLDEACGYPITGSLGATLVRASSDPVTAAARGAEARRACVEQWSGELAARAVARALGLEREATAARFASCTRW
jgi:glycosyltransferase involved in cell wall biosynthesis